MPNVEVSQWDLAAGTAPLAGEGASMRQVFVKAGYISARHSHEHEQFLLVLSGSARLECETGAVPLQPGTAIRFAPGAWHSAEFVADTVLLELNLATG